MIADLKPYREYKASGLPWLGQIPTHWSVRRLKFLLSEVDSRSTTGKEQLLRVSQYTGVTQRKSVDGSNEPNSRAASLVGYKRVGISDLVINIMLAWNGSLGVSRYDGIASPAYCVYRFSKDATLPWYYHELLRLPAYKGRIKIASTGVVESRLRLYSDDLGRVEAILPPTSEQEAIIRFLNWTNGRLERAIRAKQKVITLLNEQKQAIILRYITGQLDALTGKPYPEYKHSGVEWLGDVPEHWEVKRLKWVTRLQRGYDLPSDQRISGPFPVVSSGGIIDTHSESKCAGPGVVMGRYGSTDAVFYIENDYWPHNTSLFVTHFQNNIPKWCYYLLRSITKADHAGKSAVPGVDRKDLYQIVVTVPPVGEQEESVNIIEAESHILNNTINRLEREIELLREYRTRLVADVVTGKLDVREAATRLPEEAAQDIVDDADLSDETETTDEEAVL